MPGKRSQSDTIAKFNAHSYRYRHRNINSNRNCDCYLHGDPNSDCYCNCSSEPNSYSHGHSYSYSDVHTYTDCDSYVYSNGYCDSYLHTYADSYRHLYSYCDSYGYTDFNANPDIDADFSVHCSHFHRRAVKSGSVNLGQRRIHNQGYHGRANGPSDHVTKFCSGICRLLFHHYDHRYRSMIRDQVLAFFIFHMR